MDSNLNNLKDYEFNFSEVIEYAKNHKVSIVGIQLPEGLRRMQNVLAERVKCELGCEVIISTEPCVGACDIADEEFLNLGADILLHFGHSKIPCLSKTSLPVFYIECRSNMDVENVVNDSLNKFVNGEKVGILTTVQHVHKVNEISNILSKGKLTPIVSKGDCRIAYPAQVLGCNFSTAREEIKNGADSFLFVGSGYFHPLGVAISTKRKVIVADPYSNEVKEIDGVNNEIVNKIMRQRFGAIAKAKDAKSFAILVGTKKGQSRLGCALELKRMIEKHSFQVFLYSVGRIEPEYLRYYNEDAIVSTLCPRVAIDDFSRFNKPILTPIELQILLEEKDWNEFAFDEII